MQQSRRLTCIQAALVAVGPAQTKAAVAGVARLTEGRGGVDGVSSATQHISGIQKLGVGHSLQTQVVKSVAQELKKGLPSRSKPPGHVQNVFMFCST